MITLKCPTCGNVDVRKDKTSVPPGPDGLSGSLYDLYCPQCGRFESRRRDAPDFDAWMKTWEVTDAGASKR